MMRRSFATALFALCTVGSSLCLFPSCSDDTKTPTQQFISDYCDQMTACCVKGGMSADANACKMVFGSLASGAYNETAGAACIKEMHESFALDGTCGGKSCNAVFPTGSKATKNPGESCESDDDCLESPEGEVKCGFVSTGSSGDFSGNCQIHARGKDGDSPCIGTVKSEEAYPYLSSIKPPAFKGYICYLSDNLYCSTDGACSKTSALGESCSSSYGDECGLTGYCEYVSGKYACKARITENSPCTSSVQCQIGSTCSTTTQNCKLLLKNGSACTSGNECQSSMCSNKACSGGSSSSGLICFH